MAVIGVDFDHTLRKSDNTVCEGSKDAINALRENGHKILIHSCNNPKFIKRWMNENDIRYDWIWGELGISNDSDLKPVCDLYIDDRGYRFPYDGNWNNELPKIMSILNEGS